MSNLIRIKGLSRTFYLNSHKISVLDQLDLMIDQGETIAIEGSSGSGKSTLLNILGLLDQKFKGEFCVASKDVSRMSDYQKAKWRNEKVGFVFQFFHLLRPLSALENVMFPQMIKGISKRESRMIAETWLERVGLKDRMNHRSVELSGGEQQRVALARAFINNPDYLLLDEPTGNLDEKTSRSIEELIFSLSNSEKKTLILVTHDLKIASSLQKRYTLFDGKLHIKS
jgi:lipoprotein-releasing system ATP-binding protein